MTEQKYGDDLITQYLLGSLSEADTERFDEMSICDDHFADLLRAVENDLVDAYVQGELSGVKLEQFKSHYLAGPMRRAKVDFSQAFHSLVEPKRAETIQGGTLPAAAENEKHRAWFPGLAFPRKRRLALQWSMALAVLILVVIGGWLVFENQRQRQQLAQRQAEQNSVLDREQQSRPTITPADTGTREAEQTRTQDQTNKPEPPREQPQSSSSSIASFVLTPQMRGAGQLQAISIPPETGYVSMRLELEPNDFPAFRVALLDRSNDQTLWRSGQLKARVRSNVKTLDISFSARLLTPKVYVLRVTGVKGAGVSEIIGDYPFRVVE
jgi:cytoskeletal protein RodZ